MSKQKFKPRTIKEAEKVLGYHCAEVQEMAQDVAQKIIRDQIEWLDGVMKDLLPPDLYEAGAVMEKEEEIKAYAFKHGIQVVFIPDTQRIRVMLHGKAHAEFVPTFTLDGGPVTLKPEIPLDGSRN